MYALRMMTALIDFHLFPMKKKEKAFESLLFLISQSLKMAETGYRHLVRDQYAYLDRWGL